MGKYVCLPQGIKLSNQIMERTGLKIKILHMNNSGHIKIVGAKVKSVKVSAAKDPKAGWHEHPHTDTAIAFPHLGYQKVIAEKNRKKYELYFFKIFEEELNFIGATEDEAVAWLMGKLLAQEIDWDECTWYYHKCYCDDNCPPTYHRIFYKWIKKHWKGYFGESQDDDWDNLGDNDNVWASDDLGENAVSGYSECFREMEIEMGTGILTAKDFHWDDDTALDQVILDDWDDIA
jgi:hypothetical protein